jgi:hypothetical protein
MNEEIKQEAIMPDRRRLLELALKGLQADRAKLDEEIAEIKRELGNRTEGVNTQEARTAAAAPPAARKRRRMSAEARKKISEAMKRRYAEMRRLMKR